MADAYQHRLEIRATKLAAAVNRRIDTFSAALRPPGTRPPFTQMMSPNRALDTILKNWRLPQTQDWINAMDPQSRLELHNALSQHIQSQGLMPSTAQPDGMSVNGQAEMDRASMMGVNMDRASMFPMQRNVT